MTHVSVHPVFWNANVQFQTHLNAFYKAVGGDGVTSTIQLEFSNAANNCVAR